MFVRYAIERQNIKPVNKQEKKYRVQIIFRVTGYTDITAYDELGALDLANDYGVPDIAVTDEAIEYIDIIEVLKVRQKATVKKPDKRKKTKKRKKE
jgi:hypothetical protein